MSVKLPQQGTDQAGMLAQSDVRSATVTLPEGMQLNPSAANGLQACSEAQVGYKGPGGQDPLAPGAEEPLHFSNQPAACPQASKLGIVRLRTPLLGEELHGAVYLAEPAPQGEAGRNPFDSLLALYIVAEDPVLGIRAKLAGEAKLNPATGQIASTFADTPRSRSKNWTCSCSAVPPDRSPHHQPCGSYAASASFTPWSATPRQLMFLQNRRSRSPAAPTGCRARARSRSARRSSRARAACRPAATPASTCTSPAPTETNH